MVDVSVTASVQVRGGPVVSLAATLDPESYAYAALDLGPAGGAEESAEVNLLPAEGEPVLLALAARTTTGAAAGVTVTPTNGTDSGDTIEVDGQLLVANAGALAALVDGGPRTFTVANREAEAVSVEILAALGPEPAP
jgi:hypothetical protein